MENAKKNVKEWIQSGGLYIVLALLLIIIIAKEPSFLSIRNFRNILTQSSVRLIMALGVAGLIVTQGTDLSAGRQVGLVAVISATLLQHINNVNKVFPNLGEVPIIVVILIGALIGALMGLFNALLVAQFKVTPFIATLGTMIIVYGINSLYFDSVGASPIAGFDPRYTNFAQGFFDIGGFRLPFLILYALTAVFIVWVIWNKTTFGKNIFAIGGNPEAAKVSGVNVKKNLFAV